MVEPDGFGAQISLLKMRFQIQAHFQQLFGLSSEKSVEISMKIASDGFGEYFDGNIPPDVPIQVLL